MAAAGLPRESALDLERARPIRRLDGYRVESCKAIQEIVIVRRVTGPDQVLQADQVADRQLVRQEPGSEPRPDVPSRRSRTSIGTNGLRFRVERQAVGAAARVHHRLEWGYRHEHP